MKIYKLILTAILAIIAITMSAQVSLNYEAGITANAGDGLLAPHYISAGKGGTVTQQYSTLLHATLSHDIDTTKRLSWGAAVELWGGWTSSTLYGTWTEGTGLQLINPQHPARAWVQQAYAEGKYRGVFATLGQKQHHSHMVNSLLSSGDMTMSGNARPQPGLRAGFINFQDIPLTHGWVQINGELGYYKMTDENWINNHDNKYNHFTTTNYWLHYKYLYLRTKPGQRIMATVGMQAACQFGGTCTTRKDGNVEHVYHHQANAEAFFKAFIPGSGASNTGDKYYEGNHVGSWDIALDINLNNGAVVRGYYQSPWEDGSGIGKLNGFDGLWGIEYKAAGNGIINGAVIEYVDLTNQSGPIHWAPEDFENTPLTQEATGADDYYNNYAFNGYHALGMSMGSPFVQGPIYNTDGYTRFADNMMRGFHVGIMGSLSNSVAYRALASHRTSWGTPFVPRIEPVKATSFMLEATWTPRHINGLNIKAQFAMDRGTLTGNNTGALVSVTYNGNFTIGNK